MINKKIKIIGNKNIDFQDSISHLIGKEFTVLSDHESLKHVMVYSDCKEFNGEISINYNEFVTLI